jgi:hypothetical protein
MKFTPVEEPKTKETTGDAKDVVGRTREWLTREPPEGSWSVGHGGTPFGEPNIGRWVRAAGDLFLPGSIPEAARFAATLPIGGGMLSGPLMRTAAGGLAEGVANVATGKDFASGVTSGGLSQLAGEVLPGALRFGLTQRAGQKALGGRAAEIGQREISQGAAAKVREDKIAHDTALEKSVSQLEQERYKADVKARKTMEEAAATAAAERHATETRAYEQSGAQIIADGFKQKVPALREFPSTEAGLLNMVSGEGPQRVSKAFDEAIKAVIQSGRGRKIEIRADDAKALGLKPTGLRQMDKTQRPVGDVDGGQLAESLLGFWKTDHGVYRRGVGALDRADIGDPVARGEYRAAQALFDFAERSQMLKGGTFNPDLARAAFDRVKKLDTLRKRGQGDMFTGPVAEAVNRPAPVLRTPAPSPEVNPPARRAILQPPELETPTQLSPTPEGVRTRTIPTASWWQGAFIGEIPALLGAVVTGHPNYALSGLGGAAGAAGAMGLSGRRVITAAPLPTELELFLRRLLTLEAQEAASLMGTAP